MFNFPLISSDASNINPFNYVFNIPLNKKINKTNEYRKHKSRMR